MDPTTFPAPPTTDPESQPSTPPTAAAPVAEAPAAQPAASAVPAAAPAAAAPAATPAAAQPTVVRPVRRQGLGGIVDEIRDAIAGTTTTKIFEDPITGDKYVKPVPLTHGQQWLRIASDAFRGAAAGLKAGKGVKGGPGAAVSAGIDSEDAVKEKRAALPQEQQAQIKAQQLDKFNSIKLKHDAAANDFALTRLKVAATNSDIEFAQKQQDREKELGSSDLGVYADPAALTAVKERDPNFWKNVYGNDIVTVPEIAPDGTRQGIHVYLRTQGIGNQVVPKGTTVMDFVPPKKPGEKPQLVPRTLSTTATQNQVDAWNGAAYKKQQDYLKNEAELANKKAETKMHEASANKANAEATKARSESQAPKGDNDTKTDIAQGLASGRYVMGKDIPTRTSKDQTTAAEYTRAANDYSMKTFGLPYSPEIIRQEIKLAENPKTQAFLSAIDRFVGSPGSPGQLDQVLDLAKKAGITDKAAPLNTWTQKIKELYGDTAAKNFEQGLSDTQTALGTLVGNPLLGSGESDLKLRTAQKQFGKDVTLSDLDGAVKTSKEILGRARDALAKNNRYIQQRYGIQLSPTPNPNAGGGGGTAVSLSQARNLPEWKGKSDEQIKAAIKAAGHQVVD